MSKYLNFIAENLMSNIYKKIKYDSSIIIEKKDKYIK